MDLIDQQDQLFQMLEQGAIAITPNNRLSTHLLETYFTQQAKTATNKPRIEPWTQFLQNTYDQWLCFQPATLLSAMQTRLLWRKILTAQQDILFNEGLLDQVIKAWEICKQWLQPPTSPWPLANKQCQQFQQWAQQFDQACQDLQAITLADLPDLLAKSTLPSQIKPIIWVCFDELTPQQQQLQQALTAQNIVQYRYELPTRSSQIHKLAASDEIEEYRSLFHWLNEQLEERDRTVGVVIPDLAAKKEGFARLCETHLPKGSYTISLGKSLAEFPLVAHACQWLQLEARSLTQQQIELLIYSPWLKGGQTEFMARSQCRQDNQNLARPQINFTLFCEQIKKSAPILHSLLTHITPIPATASPQEWVHFFIQRLEQFGFPGDAVLDSLHYQLYQRLLQLFDEFRGFSLLYKQLTREEAFYLLGSLTSHTLFQSQSPRFPIQFSGLLEASGCAFDSLWITGMTDLCLPQKIKLHPLIPKALQRELAMPHSNPGRELDFARQGLHRLCAGSPLVIASYPSLSEDKPLLPSPLIANWPNYPFALPSHQPERQPMEQLEENYLHPIPEDRQVSGGSTLLANQSKCPFRAFAQHRLNAKAEQSIQEGIDNRERGNLIHKILEKLWGQLGDQSKLLALDPADCQQLLAEIILKTLKETANNNELLHDPLIREIELERLSRLIQQNLDWEKQREAFTIAELEKEHQLSLGRLQLNLRLDRLDELADGNKWIIDYKSSLPVSKPWQEERPQEPQLLLYALLDEAIRALHFVQLKSGQPAYASFSEQKLTLSGNQSLKEGEGWDDYRVRWQSQLNQLAEEYLKGHCPPQPNKASVCEHCDFGSLCRFNFEG